MGSGTRWICGSTLLAVGFGAIYPFKILCSHLGRKNNKTKFFGAFMRIL
jgi:hypothetical protein